MAETDTEKQMQKLIEHIQRNALSIKDATTKLEQTEMKWFRAQEQRIAAQEQLEQAIEYETLAAALLEGEINSIKYHEKEIIETAREIVDLANTIPREAEAPQDEGAPQSSNL